MVIPAISGYKILFLYLFSTKSHLMTTFPIAEELVARGHDVRIVSPFKLKTSYPNLKQDVLTGIMDFTDDFSKDMMENYNSYTSLLDSFQTGFFTEMIGDDVLSTPLVQQLIKQGKQYDVIVANAVIGDLAVALSPLLANYTMVMSAGPLPPWIPSPSPKPPAAVPTYLLAWESEMNFPRRIVNSAIHVGFKLLMKFDIWPTTDRVVKKYAPEVPPVEDSWSSVVLYLENSDPILVPSRPSVPNVVTYVAPHCRAAEALQEKFVKIFEKAGDDGVIIFSMGTLLKANLMLPETRNAFLNAFARLKQVVIWKFEDDSFKIPSNVIVTKWIPQNDLLGHPKTRLLITHGGLLSLQEALYHGVPVVGIPFFADQPGNVARLGELGIGEMLLFNNITADNVYNIINKILTDPSYSNNVEKYSAMFRDLPLTVSAAKRAATWMEYAVRYNGARLLQPTGRALNLFQYCLIDVAVFIIASIAAVFYCSYKFLRFVVSKVGKRCKMKKA